MSDEIPALISPDGLMPTKPVYHVAVLPGDGIGVDVTEEAVSVLQAVERSLNAFTLDLKKYEGGAQCYKRTGSDLPPETLVACCQADAVLLGAMGHPDIRKQDGTELTPQVALRVELDLYAGVRPCKLYPGVRSPLANVKPGDIDFVILREQTEGLFVSQNAGIVLHDQVASDTMMMTRFGITRICEYAFNLARERPRVKANGSHKVTCVDKSNIFKSFAFFRKIFDDVAARHPTIARNHNYIDAQALFLVQKPQQFDVIVTENMFGDILSDLGAALIGGMGMAPSADIGDNHGVFQPAHGTAPDIAGKGVANPIAAILSAAMMLNWMGRRRNDRMLLRAAQNIELAVTDVLSSGRAIPPDLGGVATTQDVGNAVVQSLRKLPK
jgi:3-isopropylmalate dehydrogenase